MKAHSMSAYIMGSHIVYIIKAKNHTRF